MFSDTTAANQNSVMRLRSVTNSYLNNCTFHSQSSTSQTCSVLYVSKNSVIKIENSLFYNNNAESDLGSTTVIAGSSAMELQNVRFQYNVAGTAPVVLVSRNSKLILNESYIL